MKFTLYIYCFLFACNGYSQYDATTNKNNSQNSNLNFEKIKQRTYVGGEIGLSFNNNSTFLLLAPLVGYDLTNAFSVGVSGLYQLRRLSTFNGTPQNFVAFGGGLFARLRPIDPIIIQAEFDLFNTEDLAGGTLNRIRVPAFLTGLGYANSFGPGSYYQVLLLYDFINDPNMPLAPFIITPLHLKFGIVFHL